MNGRDFHQLLGSLEPEELDLPISELVDLYDRPVCRDCGRFHATP
jgi:hypothetical protein